MTLTDSVVQRRLHAITRATEEGNVAAVCRQLGISRTLYYRWRKRFIQYGVDGLQPKRRGPVQGRPAEVPHHVERRVIALALAWPTWGPLRLAAQLQRDGVQIAPSTVYRALRRAGLNTTQLRLAVMEKHSASARGLLTERTRRKLVAAKGGPRHVQASRPGELVCVDTFYVGKLKGVGKIWQYTACDAATSFGLARLIPGNPNSSKAASFLLDELLPRFEKLGWPLERVLTDGGSEFMDRFTLACSEHGIRRTRIKPRHAWTNGFVERLQGTILREHWRIAFRRQYFTSLLQLRRSLDGFLDFYNWHRPHTGYRTRGRTPGQTLLSHKDTAA